MSVRNDATVKVPHSLSKPPYNQTVLKLNGLSVIESCLHTQGTKGTMFLEDHLLLFVLGGVYKVRFGNQEYAVSKNQMILLQKSIVVEYEKSGDPESEYRLDYMLFFLKEDVLREFIKLADHKVSYPALLVPVCVHPVNDRLVSYLDSLKPYFKEPDRINDGLVKLKLLELLFDVADADDRFLLHFLQLKRKTRKEIAEVMEENYMNPVSISDLAYLSGRSLSSFKREFQAMYNTSPLQWMRNRRLDKAKELLSQSDLSVTDICFTIGFENVAHFSKVFKARFGYPPSALKKA
ncbi:helix-turn-helix domain-containing protein [Paenibacillus hamazuiensis]|uniref:helix-turn-helix domain-containing protein n=1 Tax=Paenibacillus hamazuiensis TaxID=2936508 RepID=UPI00201042D4|nr:AraC family transcriptional regulator [Paenibacillus hamazuiensis]